MSMPSSPSFSDFSCSGEPFGDCLNVAIITFHMHACRCCLSICSVGALRKHSVPKCPLSRTGGLCCPVAAWPSVLVQIACLDNLRHRRPVLLAACAVVL
jgi:hypothetical protein